MVNLGISRIFPTLFPKLISVIIHIPPQYILYGRENSNLYLCALGATRAEASSDPPFQFC